MDAEINLVRMFREDGTPLPAFSLSDHPSANPKAFAYNDYATRCDVPPATVTYWWTARSKDLFYLAGIVIGGTNRTSGHPQFSLISRGYTRNDAAKLLSADFDRNDVPQPVREAFLSFFPEALARS